MKHCWYLLEQCGDRGNCFEVNALIQFTGSQGIRQVITKKLTILKTYREIKHISNQLKKGEFKNKHYPMELLWPWPTVFITKGIRRAGRHADLPHHEKKIYIYMYLYLYTLLGEKIKTQINEQLGQHGMAQHTTPHHHTLQSLWTRDLPISVWPLCARGTMRLLTPVQIARPRGLSCDRGPRPKITHPANEVTEKKF